jgi:Transposase DDE domain
MELQLFNSIVQMMSELIKPSRSRNYCFSDFDILKVWFWSVIHDRPVSWAVQRRNWAIHQRKRNLPSNTTMSRRLRSSSVRELLKTLEEKIIEPKIKDSLVWLIDGKPLPISGCSKDRQAGYGRAAGGKAKGYKLHAIIGKNGELASWRIAPMNKDERVMAERMLKSTKIEGYVVADGNYDSNKLFKTCDDKQNLQMVVRRRYGSKSGLGHRKQTAGRLRSKEILENPDPKFGNDLLAQRDSIERFFGNLTNWGGGMTCLPSWARTYRRVHRWVQAKLLLNGLRRMAL